MRRPLFAGMLAALARLGGRTIDPAANAPELVGMPELRPDRYRKWRKRTAATFRDGVRRNNRKRGWTGKATMIGCPGAAPDGHHDPKRWHLKPGDRRAP